MSKLQLGKPRVATLIAFHMDHTGAAVNGAIDTTADVTLFYAYSGGAFKAARE